MGKKINCCHTYYSYKVDLGLSALDQQKLVDGYTKLVKNFVSYWWIRHGFWMLLVKNFYWYLISVSIYISFYPTAEIFLQRGTGLSTPLTASSMSQFKSAEDLVGYLKHFRADNIVNDAEFMRVHLVPDAGPWTILGQV